MQSVKSYVKDTSDLLRKIKELGKVPKGAISCTADFIDLIIPHEEGLDVLSEELETFQDKKIAKDLKRIYLRLINLF